MPTLPTRTVIPPAALTGVAPTLPAPDGFPAGTEFVIFEFDMPLANVPGRGWSSWWGGVERHFDPRGRLKPDNNWTAGSFGQWLAVVQATMPSDTP